MSTEVAGRGTTLIIMGLMVAGAIYWSGVGLPPESSGPPPSVNEMRFGVKPIRNEWDRSYSIVTEYLKERANDPASIAIDGCTPVKLSANGWVVGCDYRGANTFGGIIRKSNWFTIVHGVVVEMHEPEKFKR